MEIFSLHITTNYFQEQLMFRFGWVKVKLYDISTMYKIKRYTNNFSMNINLNINNCYGHILAF